MADSKHVVLTLVKIKHRATEARLNPFLTCLSRLDPILTELEDECIDFHGSAGGSCEFYTKSSMAMCDDVSKSGQSPLRTVNSTKNKI